MDSNKTALAAVKDAALGDLPYISGKLEILKAAAEGAESYCEYRGRSDKAIENARLMFAAFPMLADDIIKDLDDLQDKLTEILKVIDIK